MSTALPWDRFTPAEPEPAPAPPIVQPPAGPAPQPPVIVPAPAGPPRPAAPGPDVAALARDLLNEALHYAKDSVAAVMAGHTVDLTHPTVTAQTATGHELVVADAKSRSMRTLVQGLCIDLFAAVLAVIGTLSGADPFAAETWTVVGALLIKTLVQTVAAYVMRLRVTPTIRTEGEKLALMPVPRPMLDEQEIQR